MAISKDKSVIKVLEALLYGQRIKLGQEEYVMSDDNDLCLVAHDQNKKEHYLKTDISLASFVKWSEKVSFDQLFILAAERVIREKRT